MAKVDEGVFAIAEFKGLRNVVPEDQLDVGDLSAAEDVDVLDSGDLQVRMGNSAAKDATASHSLWAHGSLCLVVQGTTLYRVMPDYSKVAMRTGLTANLPMSYEMVGSRVYYHNGAQRGVVENFTHRSWGLEVPATPLAAAYPGALPAGRYQFALTYLRNDGQQSGAARAGSIVLGGSTSQNVSVVIPADSVNPDSRSVTFSSPGSNSEGILFSQIPVPTDPGVVAKVLWLSKANGEVLYEYAVLPVSAVTAMAVEVKPGIADLKTMHLGPPPAGEIVAYFNGVMLVASGNALYPSEPYSPELFDYRKRYTLLDRIVTVACMTDGVHCGTLSQNVWLGGREPSQWTYSETADYGVIPRSLAWATNSQLGKGEGSGSTAFVMTERGVCRLGDGGEFRNLTEARFAYPIGETGAGLVRRHGGMSQYIGVMRGITSAGNSFN